MMNRDEGCRRWINYLQIKLLVVMIWAFAALEINALVQLSKLNLDRQVYALVMFCIGLVSVAVLCTFTRQLETKSKRLKLILYYQGFNLGVAVIIFCTCTLDTHLTLQLVGSAGLGLFPSLFLCALAYIVNSSNRMLMGVLDISTLWVVIDSPAPGNPVDECSVCLLPVLEGGCKLNRCQHPFHQRCIGNWLARSVIKTCPMCTVELV